MKASKLPARLYETLWLGITQIEAQSMLLSMTMGDWPNMKKEPRAKLHRSVFSQAFPDELKVKNKVTPKDLVAILSRV